MVKPLFLYCSVAYHLLLRDKGTDKGTVLGNVQKSADALKGGGGPVASVSKVS